MYFTVSGRSPIPLASYHGLGCRLAYPLPRRQVTDWEMKCACTGEFALVLPLHFQFIEARFLA
jgi:hypothetical protein